MPFAFRPLPGSSSSITDAADFEALSAADQAEHHDLWDFNSTFILYIRTSNTRLDKWLNVLGADADPELDPAHPCLDHHLMCVVTEDDGSVKPHDYTFELGESFVKGLLAGKWDLLYFHKHPLVRLRAHRSRSLAPKVVPKNQQRLTATASATGKWRHVTSPALRLHVTMLCLASRSSSTRSSHKLRLRR